MCAFQGKIDEFKTEETRKGGGIEGMEKVNKAISLLVEAIVRWQEEKRAKTPRGVLRDTMKNIPIEETHPFMMCRTLPWESLPP